MISKLRLFVVGVCLLFAGSLAQASFVPITVFPNPISFGSVADNTTGYQVVYVTNATANSVVVTNMSITGTNSANFAFYGSSCVLTISPGQTCTMQMSFTPTSVTNYLANLVITVQGLNQPVTVSLQGSGGNPAPTITSLSPETVYVNSAAITLTVNGTGFVPGALIYFENIPLTTTYVSSTQLTAPISASYLTGTGSDFVEVVNPPPGGGYSGTSYFYVVALNPSLSNAAPSSVVATTTPTPIVLTGGNFMTGATVQWNGKPRATTYIDSSQVQFQPNAADLSSASIAQLSVSNPAPGGISPAINFNVTYPAKVTILNLPANGLVWDPYAQRIYASLPSSYGTQGNSIAVINPSLGRVAGYYFAGSEPNQLALSSDSKYLYAGLNGNGTVQRLDLPTFAPDIDISLGTNSYGSQNTAISLQVSPADSHTIAVAEGTTGCCGITGLYFYKDSAQLPDNITYPYIGDILFANSTTLYGYYQSTVSQVTVSSNGGTLGTQWNGLLDGTLIEYASGLLYDNYGHVLNPQTSLLVGSYDVTGSGCCSSNFQLLPDSPINRVFVLGITPFFNNALGITSYNLSKFTPVAVTNLSQLSAGTTLGFIPWGKNGLAFIMQTGCCGNTTSQVVLVQSPTMLLTASGTKNPPPVAQSLSPSSATHGGWNFPVTVQGSGFVPGSQVTWNGTALTADYVSATQLKLYVPAASIASAGAASVVVTNPAPGGGKSTALAFTIN
jgi:trimeric autotransporter adhesin